MARALDRSLLLLGPSKGPSGRDASRMLASASLALQRAIGLAADPLIVEPTPEALVADALRPGILAVGLTARWRREGLGAPGPRWRRRPGCRPSSSGVDCGPAALPPARSDDPVHLDD